MSFKPALQVNKEAVKTLCLDVGVREAARQMGLSENTVKAWSLRGKWFKQPSLPPTIAASVQLHKSDRIVSAPTAPNASDTLVRILENDSKRTKIGLATATRKAAERFASKSGEQIIDQASELRQIAAAASTVHGWNDKGDGGLNLQLGVMITGMD